MNAQPRYARPSYSVDEITALCDEMVSLSRAGIPLDQGLIQLAEDLPPRLGSQAKQIGEKLQAGENLADVVAGDNAPFPEIYRSVVEAGLRSGKLTVALEGFARLARQLSELRRLAISALVYPILLLVLTLVISTLVLRQLGGSIRDGLHSLRGRGTDGDATSVLLDFYAVWADWFWVVPLALLCVGLFWLAATQFGLWSGWINSLPGVGRLLRNSRLQAFSEVLELLVRQDVPLQTALRLAGNASGGVELARDAHQLAEQIERGDVQSGSAENAKRGIPPLVRWSLQNSQSAGRLELTLARASDTYRRRTEDAAIWLRKTLPVIFSFTLGGVVTMLYAVTVFVPWYTVLQSLGDAMESM